MHILLFANGVAQQGTMVERVLNDLESPYIVCADGGALIAQHFNFVPQTIIGDLDSLTAEQVAEFEKLGAVVYRYPPEKDETDLELTLQWCIEQSAQSIHIIGALGGRFDQTLANIYLLSLPELASVHVEVVDAEQSMQLLRAGTHTINGQSGDTISLIPLGDMVQGITTTNLQYPLRNESLFLGPARGVSNVMDSDTAQVEIRDGLLLLVHTVGRA